MVKRAGGALLPTISIDHAARRPIATQLYVALRDAILSGAVAAGTRLPASRALARDVSVSRTTVIDAFERLIADDILIARVGAGTYVNPALAAERPNAPAAGRGTALPRRAPRLSSAMRWTVEHLVERSRLPHALRAFATGLPALDEFPMALWSRFAARHWRAGRAEVMGYGDAAGDLVLRQAIVAHLGANRGIACDLDQVFITGGAQEAFLRIGALLLNPGDKVWFENPGAIGARNSLLAAGAELVPVPVDSDGLQVGEALRRSGRFRLAFVTPSHQQPLGHIMSLERRLALVRSAEQAGAWIIEDDYDGEFCFGRRPISTLQSVDRSGSVIYVGTFSKSLFPALRLGFMLVPPSLVGPLRTISAAFSPGVPSSVQAIVAEFIAEGHFAAHIRRMRRIYQERHDVLCAAAKTRLAGLLAVARTDSGLHTIGILPRWLPEEAVARALAARHVIASPIARFSIERAAVNGLVLGFGAVRPAEIEHGVAMLGEVLEELAATSQRGRPRARHDPLALRNV
ncbi:MAG: PLP-dependent aminotransferase family protein [Acetobacteraceae bacterium]